MTRPLHVVRRLAFEIRRPVMSNILERCPFLRIRTAVFHEIPPLGGGRTGCHRVRIGRLRRQFVLGGKGKGDGHYIPLAYAINQLFTFPFPLPLLPSLAPAARFGHPRNRNALPERQSLHISA